MYDESQQAVLFTSNPPGEGDITEIHYAALAEWRVVFVLSMQDALNEIDLKIFLNHVCLDDDAVV